MCGASAFQLDRTVPAWTRSDCRHRGAAGLSRYLNLNRRGAGRGWNDDEVAPIRGAAAFDDLAARSHRIDDSGTGGVSGEGCQRLERPGAVGARGERQRIGRATLVGPGLRQRQRTQAADASPHQ